MIKADNAVLTLIDVQGALAQLMHEKEVLFDNLRKLVMGMQALDIPILWVEQNSEKMGPTLPELRELLEPARPINKMSFSCCGNAEFSGALEKLDRKHVLLAGIEAHVCVAQTAIQLMEKGYTVEVVADAVSSRTFSNKHLALQRIAASGARLTSVEMLLFEILGTAEHPAFKKILKIVK